jgi:hypothetical protein
LPYRPRRDSIVAEAQQPAPNKQPKPSKRDIPSSWFDGIQWPPNPKAECESAAEGKLKQAREFLEKGKVDKAKECVEEIIRKYPDSKGMKEVIELYNTLK